jgi:hypothetical protein
MATLQASSSSPPERKQTCSESPRRYGFMDPGPSVAIRLSHGYPPAAARAELAMIVRHCGEIVTKGRVIQLLASLYHPRI